MGSWPATDGAAFRASRHQGLHRPRDPDHQDPLTRGHPLCADLNRPPKLQDVDVFLFLLFFVAGRPSGNSFFVDGHDLDAKRNYSLPSARHTVVDDTTEGKLEHD